MDFSKVMEGLSWFGEKINEAIWGIVYQMASSFVTEAFGLIVKYIMLETDPNSFFDYKGYLTIMQAIAFSLLLFAIAWEGVKYQSGALAEEITLQQLIFKSSAAAICIYFLPFALTNFFIKINNYFVKMILSHGIKITPGDIGPFAPILQPQKLTQMIIIMFFVLAIAFVVLAVIAGMRYIEIIILTMIAPLAAVSIVRDGELLDVWIRETIAVVFTQPLQLFLLSMLLNIVGKMNANDPMLFIIAIGCLIIMITGPTVLRKFVYSTGVGSAGARSVGSAGKMAAYKAIGKGAFK